MLVAAADADPDAPRRALLPVAALAIAMMLAEGLVAPAWSGTSLGMDLRGVVSEWPEGARLAPDTYLTKVREWTRIRSSAFAASIG
jgi:hypothetical protein